MSDEASDKIASFLNVCETDPDRALAAIAATLIKKPELANDGVQLFATVIAHGSKGLFSQLREHPGNDPLSMTADELSTCLGINDVQLNHLEEGLRAARTLEHHHPGALTMFGTDEDRQGEIKVDMMAAVLDRCRPGRAQELLGKTKLLYFGPERIKRWTGMDQDEGAALYEKVCSVPFSFETVVRTALLMGDGTEDDGREYVNVMLFTKAPPAVWPADGTLGDVLNLAGSTHLHTGQVFSAPSADQRSEGCTSLPKKGLLRRLLGS